MITHLVYIILSLILLYFGASFLVKGASSLALKAGISSLVIGLTVVAFGTSTPEFFVSLEAAMASKGGIAIGNIIGSNIFNIGIILGLAALIHPLTVHAQIIRIDIPIMIGTVALFILFFVNKTISRFEGIVLFSGIIIYTIFIVKKSKQEHKKKVLNEYKDLTKSSGGKLIYDLLYIAGGLTTLIVGSKLLVSGAVGLAKSLNVSDTIIGLTIVAAGTSMPELATSVVAAFKKQPDIAIGNIVGSNIFNILFILGASSIIKPISANEIDIIDYLVMAGFSLLLLPLAKSGFKLVKWEGIMLLVFYGVYLFYLWPK